jgi:hypothetical protein
MTKQWKCYAKKPKQIRNAKDLLKFFEAIPAVKWCANARGYNGKRCALGHLGAAYCDDVNSADVPTDGFSTTDLWHVNDDYLNGSAKLDGKSIKSRVVNFIKANIDR